MSNINDLAEILGYKKMELDTLGYPVWTNGKTKLDPANMNALFEIIENHKWKVALVRKETLAKENIGLAWNASIFIGEGEDLISFSSDPSCTNVYEALIYVIVDALKYAKDKK